MPAEASWTARATEAIRALAATGKPFTAEDVRRLVGKPDRANWVGPTLAAAHQRGEIRQLGSATAARRPRKGSSTYVWIGVDNAGGEAGSPA